MDEALLQGLIDVDEYVLRIVKDVDAEQSLIIRNRLQKDRDLFLTRLDAIFETRNRNFLAHKYASRWRLILAQKRYNQEIQTRARIEEELDELRGDYRTKSRQLRDAQARIKELSASKTHAQDVSGLAAQVKDLIKQLEVEKAEKALILARYEKDASSKNSSKTNDKLKVAPLSSSSGYNTRYGGESVTRMVREYQSRIQRLEEELAEEKLRRANETALKLEKEAECAKLRHDLEDAKAEVISLQLKIARMEAGISFAPSVPMKENIDEENFNNVLPEFHELPKIQATNANVMRKSFFRPATSSLNKSGASNNRQAVLGAITENEADDRDGPSDCTQQ